jgi:hypothetical protein
MSEYSFGGETIVEDDLLARPVPPSRVWTHVFGDMKAAQVAPLKLQLISPAKENSTSITNANIIYAISF